MTIFYAWCSRVSSAFDINSPRFFTIYANINPVAIHGSLLTVHVNIKSQSLTSLFPRFQLERFLHLHPHNSSSIPCSSHPPSVELAQSNTPSSWSNEVPNSPSQWLCSTYAALPYLVHAWLHFAAYSLRLCILLSVHLFSSQDNAGRSIAPISPPTLLYDQDSSVSTKRSTSIWLLQRRSSLRRP